MATIEINVNIKAEDLSAALNNFANTIVSMMMAGAEAPQETAAEIKRALTPAEPPKAKPKAKAEPKPEPKPDAAEAISMPEVNADDSTVPGVKEHFGTPEDEKEQRDKLKKLLAAAVRAGKNAEAAELVKSFGVKKISEVPADKLAEAITKAGEL